MIIDFHTHIFPDFLAEKAVNGLKASSGYQNAIDGKASDLIEEMDSSGVSLSVNLPVMTKTLHFSDTLDKLQRQNEEQSKILSFAPIHPLLENPQEQIKEIAKRGFKGVKLHPFFQAQNVDSIETERIIGYASENGLITVVHTGTDASFPNVDRATPKQILHLISDVKPQNLVLAHMGALGYAEQVLDCLCGVEAFFDTSFCVDEIEESLFKSIVLAHGEDKILFGTDSPWKSQKAYVKKFKEMNFDKSVEEKILFKNAKKLLKID